MYMYIHQCIYAYIYIYLHMYSALMLPLGLKD